MSDVWKEKDIFNLIQLSRTESTYFQNMLVTSLYYWEYTTNTFQLPCGMLTPMLFDVAAITGLLPDGGNFDPNENDEDNIEFDSNYANFTRYIKDYHVTDTLEFTTEEHIAFLALWLSRCIFCCRSLKVQKRYFTLANQLHKGKDACLNQLILGSLYESLGEAIEAWRNIKPKDSLLLAGPFWLLRVWLNAKFETSINVQRPDDIDAIISGISTEGVQLNLLTPTNKSRSYIEAYFTYFLMFAK